MKKYRVKVIQLLLKNNKLAQSGELVSESQLIGTPKDLITEGFIEEAKDSKKEAAENKKQKELEAQKVYAERSEKLAKIGFSYTDNGFENEEFDIKLDQHHDDVKNMDDAEFESLVEESTTELESAKAFKEAKEKGELNEDQLNSITMDAIKEYADGHSYKYDDKAKKPELVKQVLKAEKVEE